MRVFAVQRERQSALTTNICAQIATPSLFPSVRTGRPLSRSTAPPSPSPIWSGPGPLFANFGAAPPIISLQHADSHCCVLRSPDELRRQSVAPGQTHTHVFSVHSLSLSLSLLTMYRPRSSLFSYILLYILVMLWWWWIDCLFCAALPPSHPPQPYPVITDVLTESH